MMRKATGSGSPNQQPPASAVDRLVPHERAPRPSATSKRRANLAVRGEGEPETGPPFAVEILDITSHWKNTHLLDLGITLAVFAGCRGWPRSVARSRQGRNASRQNHYLRVRHGRRPDRRRPGVGPRQVGWRGDRG